MEMERIGSQPAGFAGEIALVLLVPSSEMESADGEVVDDRGFAVDVERAVEKAMTGSSLVAAVGKAASEHGAVASVE